MPSIQLSPNASQDDQFAIGSTCGIPEGGELSPWKCIHLLFATGIGTGVLVLPYTMSTVGWEPMIFLSLAGGLLSAVTTAMIFEAVAHIARERRAALFVSNEGHGEGDIAPITYGDALVASTGKPGLMIFLDLILISYSLGSVIARVIFLNDILCHLPFWKLGDLATKVLVCAIQCPFMLVDSVGLLSKFAPLSVLTLLAVTAVVISECPNYMEKRSAEVVRVGDLSKLPGGLCVCMFALHWHTNSVAVARELRNPTPAKSIGIAVAASAILGLLYMLMAIGGYLSFGAAVEEDIVSMYPPDEALFICVRLTLSLSILIACPVNLMPTRESMIALVRKVVPSFGKSRVVRQILGIAIVGLVLLFSILIPQVVALIKVMGGALATFLMIIFPTTIWGLMLHAKRFPMIAIVTGLIAIFLILSAFGVL